MANATSMSDARTTKILHQNSKFLTKKTGGTKVFSDFRTTGTNDQKLFLGVYSKKVQMFKFSKVFDKKKLGVPKFFLNSYFWRKKSEKFSGGMFKKSANILIFKVLYIQKTGGT